MDTILIYFHVFIFSHHPLSYSPWCDCMSGHFEVVTQSTHFKTLYLYPNRWSVLKHVLSFFFYMNVLSFFTLSTFVSFEISQTIPSFLSDSYHTAILDVSEFLWSVLYSSKNVRQDIGDSETCSKVCPLAIHLERPPSPLVLDLHPCSLFQAPYSCQHSDTMISNVLSKPTELEFISILSNSLTLNSSNFSSRSRPKTISIDLPNN